MENFWKDLPKPFFILAPMEAVTDVIFRHVVARAAAPDVFFTEFTNTNSWCSPKGEHSTRGRLIFTPDEQPIVAQIWGDVPEYFEQMARGMKEQGFRGIDINMCCPAPNVAPKGKGAGLIRRPDLATDIIAAVKAAGLPTSVKTRIGYTYPQEYSDWIEHLLHQSLTNLSIHMRTRKEMSKVAPHREFIDDIIAMRDRIAPDTLLTINGDIENRAEGLALIEQHPGINCIMIGRGVFHNPFAFEKEPRTHTTEELFDLLRYHLDLYDTYGAETHRPYDTLKRFYKIYVKDFDGAKELREQLMHTKSTDDVRTLIV
ncbi:MAG TPA: tRNA-dihydrouridine synthase [Candidatus Saccharimonadaceae bacterium]|nr:tRNA-dihydrouridine synthase [Candidatus Saccharimonadaceae bacterium]